nr:MAG TPA: hypothetical protein [Caudoviricetes sp.]
MCALLSRITDSPKSGSSPMRVRSFRTKTGGVPLFVVTLPS